MLPFLTFDLSLSLLRGLTSYSNLVVYHSLIILLHVGLYRLLLQELVTPMIDLFHNIDLFEELLEELLIFLPVFDLHHCVAGVSDLYLVINWYSFSFSLQLRII